MSPTEAGVHKICKGPTNDGEEIHTNQPAHTADTKTVHDIKSLVNNMYPL